VLLAVASLSMATAHLARADEVQIPLEMDRRFLESLLRERVFVGEGHRLRISGDETGCQGLELSRPRVRIRSGQILLRTDAIARIGQTVGGRCLRLVEWHGQLELDQRPVVGSDRRSALLRMSSWRALTPAGAPDTLSTTVGHWLEQLLPSDLKQVRIDLNGPLADLEALLARVVTAEDAAHLKAILSSLSIRDVAALDERVTVTLAVVAPRPITPPAREPTLDAVELAQLERRLENVDGFVTATLEHLTRGADSPAQADALLDVLLETRIELVELLGEAERYERDPVRVLFVDTWDRLTSILRSTAGQAADHASAVRLFSFIGGGNLLRALDALGPSAGIDLSSDGLRRLARILIPEESLDPLRFDESVNPALRRALGFGEPVPLPEPGEESSWLDWLVKPARAAEGLDRSLVRKLNHWVPRKSDMDTYLPMVRDVLDHVATEQLRAKPLDAAFHREFRLLLAATAWQESCWRQFVARNDKRVPLQSRSGDIGLMQVNQRVWRGFYDVHALKWDLVYNARSGADILQHFLVRYALRHGEHKTTGKRESLARSAYAAYNGGPRQYDRYRRANATKREKRVDGLFYEKYRALRSGRSLAVKACFE